jgi:hypothetical protein
MLKKYIRGKGGEKWGSWERREVGRRGGARERVQGNKEISVLERECEKRK